MPIETIENKHWKLSISPEVGASIASLQIKLNQDWHDLLRETPKEAVEAGKPSPFSSFTLAPFSNRLKDAKFEFLGQTHQLKASSADGSTQHGDVRSQHWTLQNKIDTKLELSLDTRDCEAFNFPFPFTMRVRYELQDDIFVTHLALTNTGTKHMPAGFGVHPYFNRHIAGSEEVQLGFQAEAHYEVDADMIPTAKLSSPAGLLDFQNARAVEGFALNDLFRDWDALRLVWPEFVSLDIYADAIFKHLVVFTHADGSLAVEPVTNATNGFNLMADGFEGHGVRVLAPSETLEGSIFFKVNLLAS